MPEETGDQPESRWLLQPPGRGEVHVEVGVGSDVELSPEARGALERLLSSLEASGGAEVAGFASVSGPCTDYNLCTAFQHCLPPQTRPCRPWHHRPIASIARWS